MIAFVAINELIIETEITEVGFKERMKLHAQEHFKLNVGFEKLQFLKQGQSVPYHSWNHNEDL